MSFVEFTPQNSSTLFYGSLMVGTVSTITGIALYYIGINGSSPSIYASIGFWGMSASLISYAVLFRLIQDKKVKLPLEEVTLAQDISTLRTEITELDKEKNALQVQAGTLNETNRQLAAKKDPLEQEEQAVQTKISSLQTEYQQKQQEYNALYKTKLEVDKQLADEKKPLQAQRNQQQEELQKQVEENSLLQNKLATVLGKIPLQSAVSPLSIRFSFMQMVSIIFHFESLKAKKANNQDRINELSQLTNENNLDSIQWMAVIEHSPFKPLIEMLPEPAVWFDAMQMSDEDVEIFWQVASEKKDSSLALLISKKMAEILSVRAYKIKTKEEYEKCSFSLSNSPFSEYVIEKLIEPVALAGVERDNEMKDTALATLDKAWLCVCSKFDNSPNQVKIKARGALSWKEFYFSNFLGRVSLPVALHDVQKKLYFSLFGSHVRWLHFERPYAQDAHSVQDVERFLQEMIPFCPNLEKISLFCTNSFIATILAQCRHLKHLECNGIGQFALTNLLSQLKVQSLVFLESAVYLNEIVELKKFCPTLQNIEINSFYFLERQVYSGKEILVLDSLRIKVSAHGSSISEFLTSLNSQKVCIREVILEADIQPSWAESYKCDILSSSIQEFRIEKTKIL